VTAEAIDSMGAFHFASPKSSNLICGALVMPAWSSITFAELQIAMNDCQWRWALSSASAIWIPDGQRLVNRESA
jgi:hypothetical protein